MTRDLERLADRIHQNRAQRARLEDAGARTRARLPHIGGGTYVAGDRVFDVVTGQHGEVVDATAENVVIPTTK